MPVVGRTTVIHKHKNPTDYFEDGDMVASPHVYHKPLSRQQTGDGR